MIAVDYPLLINKNRIHRFVPSYTQTVSAPIIRKYPIRNNIQFLSTMIGSTIEISKFKDSTETDIVKHFKHPMTTNTLLIKFRACLKTIVNGSEFPESNYHSSHHEHFIGRICCFLVISA